MKPPPKPSARPSANTVVIAPGDALVKAPMYQQLHDRLRALARGRDFAAGARFLTERQVSERYGISRATANKALSNLVSEGVLEFRKGVGTFVAATTPLSFDLALLVSFTARARALGHLPSTRVVRLRRTPVRMLDTGVAAALGLSPTDPVFELERVRLADDVPVIFERRVIVARHCPRLTRRQAAGSLYALWTQDMGLSIAGARQTIRAVGAGAAGRLLALSQHAPCLLVNAVGRLVGDEPLWWESTLFRGDRHELHNHVGPTEAPLAVAPMLRDARARALV